MPDIVHKFTSAIADGGDATLVRPSNWNDDHVWPHAYDVVTLTLADGQFEFQFGRLVVSSTNRFTMQGTARMALFGWFGMPDPASFQIIGTPFRPTSSFRIRTGYANKWLSRIQLVSYTRGVIEGDGEMQVFDDNSSSRFVLTGVG